MIRRKFIEDLILASGIIVTPGLSSCMRKAVPKGEEWRIIDDYNSDQILRPYDVVIKEAEANIIKNKTAVIELLIKHAGKPISEKTVKIFQKEHETDFGTAFLQTPEDFSDIDEYNEYGRLAVGLFNCATAKCYWNERWHQPIEVEEGKRIYKTFLSEVDSAYNLDLRVKGHPLFWTVPKAIPTWLQKYSIDDQYKIIENHVKSLVEKGGNKVTRWDTVNEMLWEPVISNIPKRNWPHLESEKDIAAYVAKVLSWAREVNSEIVYSLNDYGLVKNFTKVISAKEQRIRYLNLIAELRKLNHVPDAVGVQAHIGKWYHPDEIKIALDELAEANLPIQITEFWAKEDAYQEFSKSIPKEEMEELRNSYIEMFYKMAFSHKNVNHITYWGNPFINNNMPTSTYERINKLINSEWKTSIESITNNDGLLAFRGFKGKYGLIIDNKEIKEFYLDGENAKLKIEI